MVALELDLLRRATNQLYADEVIFERNTRYQRIVVTKWKDDLRLFLNAHSGSSAAGARRVPVSTKRWRIRAYRR